MYTSIQVSENCATCVYELWRASSRCEKIKKTACIWNYIQCTRIKILSCHFTCFVCSCGRFHVVKHLHVLQYSYGTSPCWLDIHFPSYFLMIQPLLSGYFKNDWLFHSSDRQPFLVIAMGVIWVQKRFMIRRQIVWFMSSCLVILRRNDWNIRESLCVSP